MSLGIPAGPQGPIFVPDEWGGPGAVVYAYYDVENGEEYHQPGYEVPASRVYVGEILFKTSTDDVTTSMPSWSNHPSGGTWRMQGNTSTLSDASIQYMRCCLVFQRIDGVTPALQPSTMQALAGAAEQVRNCHYSSPDNRMIDCDVFVNGKWHPFTSSPDDVTEWGRNIYTAAVAGELGDVAPYQG